MGIVASLPCFPCFNCQTKAFATKVLFLLTLCNVALFVGVTLHLTSDPEGIDDDHTVHMDELNHLFSNSTHKAWEKQETSSEMTSYSNIWFVLTPGVYAIMISPDYSVEANGFTQLRSDNAKVRGLGILAMCVVVAIVSTFKHAFEAGTMFPDVNNDGTTLHRVYCEMTSTGNFEKLVRGERDAAYVYACLPSLWAVKIDWLVARVSVYGIAFMASGFSEAVHQLWAKEHPHYHALAQTFAFSTLGACVLMDVIQTVQSTDESAFELALNSIIWSSPAVFGPWMILLYTDSTARVVSFATLHDKCLNLKERSVLIALNIGMGYVAWEWSDSIFRLAHMAWHFFSGAAAIGALTLTVDWEGRFKAHAAAIAEALPEAKSSKPKLLI